MLSKQDFEDMDNKIKEIVEKSVDEISINTEFPPTTDDLKNNNEAYSIMAAILFIDIRKSTDLTENSKAKNMVKIYRAFMRMCVECVRKNGGVTRNFLGDRIMAVFMDSKTKDQKITKAIDKALNCAISMATAIDFSLNKHLRNNINNKTIDCGIGIDYGKVLLTKVGMYGVESNEEKENEVDCVWVGNVTNHASKFSDLAKGGEIFISENAYKNLSDELKGKTWEKVVKCKEQKIFSGYISKFFYSDFIDESKNDTNRENIEYEETQTSMILANAIKELDKIKEELKNKEIGVEIKKEQNEQRLREINEKYNELYDLIYDLLGAYLHRDCEINKKMASFWTEIISFLFKVGKKINYTEEEIKKSVACYLIHIYNKLEMYEESIEYMKFMAEKCKWINLKPETLKWAKENSRLHSLKFEIKWRIEHNYEEINISEFEGYLKEIEKYE